MMIMLAESTDQVVAVRRGAALGDVADAAAAPRSVDDACRRTLETLARHSSEIPFALLYVVGVDHGEARLAAAAGLAAGGPASPHVIALGASVVSRAHWCHSRWAATPGERLGARAPEGDGLHARVA